MPDNATRDAMVTELRAASQVIYDVVSTAWKSRGSIDYPHGSAPSYPTHANWCDECWSRLGDALNALLSICPNCGESYSVDEESIIEDGCCYKCTTLRDEMISA